MLSLQTFKDHAGKVFRMAQVDGINVRLHYDGEVYIVNIIKTGEKYVPQRARRLRRLAANKKMGVTLKLSDCTECGYLKSHGICVNKSCPTNQPKPVTQP